jgi:hypothetical protein
MRMQGCTRRFLAPICADDDAYFSSEGQRPKRAAGLSG